MAGPARVTAPFLDVLEMLFQAYRENKDVHGWAIIKATKRTGPTVYGVLDRLEDMRWIEGRWEEQSAEHSGPRRRFYSLTPTGVTDGRAVLLERRPRALEPRARARGWHPLPGQAGPT